MKQSTAALTVWFFSVNITNGQGRTGSLIGNIFTGDCDAIDLDRA
jgi:hypothetical protein